MVRGLADGPITESAPLLQVHDRCWRVGEVNERNHLPDGTDEIAAPAGQAWGCGLDDQG